MDVLLLNDMISPAAKLDNFPMAWFHTYNMKLYSLGDKCELIMARTISNLCNFLYVDC